MKKQYLTEHDGTFVADDRTNPKMVQLFLSHKHPQEDELEIFNRYVNKDTVFLDIGANIGTISVAMAKHVKEVHSFEPVEENLELLTENIKLNQVTNIQVHPVALGSHSGTVRLALPDPTYDAGSYTVEEGDGNVSLITLDSLDLQPTFIKMDIEGYEIEALKGARATIQKNKPVLFFEINIVETRKRGDWWLSKVSSEIRSHGYALYLPTATDKKRITSVAWEIFKLAPKALITGRLNFSVNFLALPNNI
jgi:FkbM family methyltransferase